MIVQFPYHERLRLQNFTAFSDQAMEFVSGINVLIGENGTGKTHVLKALYAWQMARHLAEPNRSGRYESLFAETYGVKAVAELQRAKSKTATASGSYGGHDWSVGIQSEAASDNGVRPFAPRPVFIPAIEMMAHARNMNGIMRDYADFDRTCFDFLAMVTAEPASRSSNHTTGVISPSLTEDMRKLKMLVPGEVEWSENEQRFYLSEKGKRLPYALVAEGMRKVSALYRLVELQWIEPGGVLFWDEPEVNLNPRWMDEIIEALVILARAGVQIFLATHDYVILKQLDLILRHKENRRSNQVQARYFSLYKERGVSKANWADNFSDLEPNSILDQFDQMLEADWKLNDEMEGTE